MLCGISQSELNTLDEHFSHIFLPHTIITNQHFIQKKLTPNDDSRKAKSGIDSSYQKREELEGFVCTGKKINNS